MSNPPINKRYKILYTSKFRKAFALKPGFRFNALRENCEDIVFATDGFKTNIEEIAEQLREAFEDFNPNRDCIVPIGNSFVNLLAGYLLMQNFPDQDIVIALYNKGIENSIPDGYTFYLINMQDLLQFAPSSEMELQDEY